MCLAFSLCQWTNCSVKAAIPISLFHFAPSEFTYPSPSVLLAEGFIGSSSEACQCFSWMGGEGKKMYYNNENLLVFIKILTLYTDSVLC